MTLIKSHIVKHNLQINTKRIFNLLLGILMFLFSRSDLIIWEKDKDRINKELVISAFNQIDIETNSDIELNLDSQEFSITKF